MRFLLTFVVCFLFLSAFGVSGAPSAISSTKAGSPTSSAKESKKWKGTLPEVARDEQAWGDLIAYLLHEKKYYGALAASSRTIRLFSELAAKEMAYQTLIELADLGYPYSLHHFFAPANIEPIWEYDLVNSYYLYKALTHERAGMKRWAESHFAKIDKQNFPKYLFYSAIQSYSNKDFGKAKEVLNKLLDNPKIADDVVMLSKVARTLARIYFEEGDYSKSFDIYENFLLHLNPVTPSDWLEAAWNLYYLKRHDEAMGYLYNLESFPGTPYLEKYVLRALIYREFCAANYMETLLSQFEDQYGETLSAIKDGQTLSSLSALKTVLSEGNSQYSQIQTLLKNLAEEAVASDSVPYGLGPLAGYFYETELQIQKKRAALYEDEFLQHSASYLITLHENLKFLLFRISQEIYNPNNVFKAEERVPASFSFPEADPFLILWPQRGDFWRNERHKFRTSLKNQCID